MSKVHVIQTPESTDNNDNSSKSLPSNWILENKVSQIDLFLIGVTIVIGGQFNGFNAAFDAGYAIAIFNILVTGIGYLCLTFCLAEMTSALPFSGGVYGFVRAFIHPWAGFLIACYELVLNLFYVAYAVYSLAKIPLVIANHGDDEGNDDSVKEADAGLLISYCLVIYVIIGCTCLVGGRLFWSFNNILACVVLGLLFIYLFGSLPNVDFNKWATSEQIFNDYSIFAFLAQSSGNYLGIQYLPLMSKDIENPRKNIPRAMIGGMLLFVLTAVGLITISCSQSPGITAIGSNINYPLSYGFQDIFSITLSQAKWLSIPGLFSMAFGFLFCYARQSLCMAQSGFLPKCFTWTTPYLGTPYVGLFCGISLCLLINVISFYSPLFLSAVSNISILAGYIVFIATAFAYLIFSSNYSSLSREFSSPLGKFGAVITILIFLFCSIGILGYEPSNISLYVMIAIFIIPSFYYFLFIANHQIFSDEEKDNLFKAYVVNANKAKKTRIMKKHPGKQALITRISGENLSARVVTNSPSGRSNITPVESEAATTINQTEQENRLDPVVPELAVTVTDDRPPPPLSSLKRDKVTGKVIHFLTASMRSVLDENKEMKELIIRQSGGLDNNLTPILEDSPV